MAPPRPGTHQRAAGRQAVWSFALTLALLSGCAFPRESPREPVHEWPFASGTDDGRRASLDPAITAATLSSLGVAWVYETDGAVTGTPTVHDGRVFIGNWQGTVAAIKLSDGTGLWARDVNARITGSVTLHGGLALFADSKARVHAVNAATGVEVWNRTIESTLNAHLYATPLIVPARGNREAFVVQAVGSDQESSSIHGKNPVDFRGSIVALELATGKEMWRTWLTPEGTTGAPVWGTPVLVPGMDLVAFGTGNAYTAPAGPLTDSIVALHVGNGTLAWAFQATKDDVFTHLNPISPDADFGSTPSIVKVGGSTLVVMGQKSSIVWAIDAATGKVAWKEGRAQPGEGIIGDTATAEGLVFAPHVTLEKVAAIDAATGAPRWNRSLGGLGYSDPVAVQGAVVVADTSGSVMGLRAATGDVLWNASVGKGGVFGGLSVAGGHLFVPVVRSEFLGDDGAVLAFAPGATSSTTAVASDTVAPGEVSMRGFEFVPRVQTIRVGDSVTWTNEDPTYHTVTFTGAHAAMHPERVVDAGQSTRIAFDEPGTYEYYCRPHASQSDDGSWTGMTGTVVVNRN